MYEAWMTKGIAIFYLCNGSMEQRLIHVLIEHLDKHVSQFLPRERKYVLSLDGNLSLNGQKWLQLAKLIEREVVQSPANTSHFLQPCDSYINKTFQTSIRCTRDDLCSMAISDTKSMDFKLKLVSEGYRAMRV